jgi:copper chaperone CopZ
MKNLIRYSVLAIALFGFTNLSAQKSGKYDTITFHVDGVCEMCQSRIETASYDVAGVKSVKWDRETGVLTAVIHKKKTTKQKVADAIAAAGYDNELAKADPEAYGKLPGCCQYNDGAVKH